MNEHIYSGTCPIHGVWGGDYDTKHICDDCKPKVDASIEQLKLKTGDTKTKKLIRG